MPLTDTGVVVKAYGGFFYINNSTSSGSQRVIEATLRGKVKRARSNLPPVLVGDNVDFTTDASPVIVGVHPRRTELIRPPIANVDQVVVVVSAKSPAPDLLLMDKILITAEVEVLEAIVVINKIDVTDPKLLARLTDHLKNTGYHVFQTSVAKGQGLDQLAQVLSGRITVLAGASGVGKSSLLAALVPGYEPKVQAVSIKSARGRHTTKHVELLSLPSGGFIADTPGFSSLDLEGVELHELSTLFPEFAEYIPDCRFSGCLHVPEPDCAVKEAVSSGKISQSRYEDYCLLVEEIKSRKKW